MKLLNYLLAAIKEKTDVVKSSDIYFDMSILQNYIIFFLIITINLKNHSSFIQTVFGKESKFWSGLLNIFSSLSKRKRKVVFGLINNLFLEEYKKIYFKEEKDESLENLFIVEQTKFSSIFAEITTYYEDETYRKMFETLLKFNISYDNFFSNQADSIKDSDKPAYKLCIAQSVIRVVFSKEKSRYYKESKFYEYEILSRIIEKDMTETKEKFRDDYKTLFRKEDLCDDIIKYMFFIFGNIVMIEAIVKPVKAVLKMREKDEKVQKDISKSEFEIIINEFVNKLSIACPMVLKILLKIVYCSVRRTFTIKEDNYSPLYTLLIFNFLITPRVQALYNLDSSGSFFLRSLNRLIRNTCYNYKFNEKDTLHEFNDLIEKYNEKLKAFVESQIMSIDLEDDKVKSSLSELFTEKFLIYPKFLFYWDSQLICNSITGGVDEIITYSKLGDIKYKY